MKRGEAKPKVRQGGLKVFEARLGFFDSVVAARSQAAALRAWGMHQNLFAEGQARVASDPAAVAAALAKPEVPLRRPIGSTDAFTEAPAALPSMPDLPAGASRARKSARPADRSRLDAAESALANLLARRKAEEADLEQRREALEAEAAAARDAFLAARDAAKAALAAARAAYRKAGGTG